MVSDRRLVIRPYRIRLIVIPVAIAFVAVFAVVAMLLRTESTGVVFGLADQISVVLVGLALGAGTMLFGRARVVADAEGVQVRNLLFGQQVPWRLIKSVSFPDGAPWARLELPADEYVPVVAIQAFDGARAVRSIRELRALHREMTTERSDPEAG